MTKRHLSYEISTLLIEEVESNDIEGGEFVNQSQVGSSNVERGKFGSMRQEPSQIGNESINEHLVTGKTCGTATDIVNRTRQCRRCQRRCHLTRTL
jgi:hypothetical protein